MTEPILPGFYPDPTICRVGDDFYLAASSFEYFPAVPIFHSTDLLTWTQLGHVFDRVDQLDLPAESSGVGGIYAPTLRHHDGLFYLVTTNVSTADRGHMIVTASDPAGPWSDPVFAAGLDGIDPDLTWDADGSCYLTWSSYAPGLEGIAQVRIDPATGEVLSQPRLLWTGSGLAWPESPHLYRVDDWWYLVIAEGGTERGHCITVARSREIDGQFVGAPHNPIFSHRSTSDVVQNAGHGDLVQTPGGDWAMVYLAARVSGITPGFHVNGRETFLAGVDWIDGWPVVDEARFEVPRSDTGFVDQFEAPDLHLRWISPGGSAALWTRQHSSGLELTAASDGSRRLLAVRTRDGSWTASARIHSRSGGVRVMVRLDDDHWCAITASENEVSATLTIAAGSIELGRSEVTDAELELWIRARAPIPAHNAPVGPDMLELGYTQQATERVLGVFDGRYLSTEVAGGFTGRVVGVSPVYGAAVISSFSYGAD